MKKYLFLLAINFCLFINAQYTLIPDNVFEQKLINQGIDSDGLLNGQVLTNDINNIIILNLNYSSNGIITDLTGIEDFIALEELYCRENAISQLNLSNNWNLKNLDCFFNILLTDLNISQNINLEYINCSGIADIFGGISIDFSNNIKLETLICENSSFNSLNLSNNTNLKTLKCSNDYNSDFGLENIFTNLDLSNNLNLEYLECNFGLLENIILPNTNTLTYIELQLQKLTNIDISQNPNLEHLDLLLNTNLTTLNTINNNNLIYLNVNKCALTQLDVSQNSSLELLALGYLWLNSTLEEPNFHNNIQNIDLTNNINLKYLSARNINLDNLNLINNDNLLNLNIENNNISSLNLANNIQLQNLIIDQNPIEILDITNNINLEYLTCVNTSMSTLNLKNNNNQILTQVFATNNPNLTCIEIDNETDANNNTGFYANWEKDTIAIYSEDCATVSIEDETLQNITLYPNPTNDILFIDKLNNIDIKHIKMFNFLGQQVLFKKDDFNQINLSILKPALYLVTIKTSKGIINTKIVKK